MVSITYDVEIPSPIPATKMYKAVVLDADTLIPKIMPQAIKNVEILEGDGGVGTVKLIHFGEGSQYKSVKHHVDALDTENLTHSYSIVEGDALVLSRLLIISRSFPLKMEDAFARTGAFITPRAGLNLVKRKSRKGKRRPWPCSRQLRLTYKPTQRLKY
ncbi:UNVERIFIED_CONTAM: Major strawberry allergen Fra a 1-3 [Sesamum calycinum]|uniref:Major strawberry allergen Fra a 1-3 n=1 Tax=Sesamum calycinum TaxID=2727403 RepID=A0AAW2LA12_9LAMI